MFDVSSRAKLSVSALAERKIASARPRKCGLLLQAEEEMLLFGQALASLIQERWGLFGFLLPLVDANLSTLGS